MEILEPFLLWDKYSMSIYYLEFGKTQSRKEQKKIEMKIYSIILDALFHFHK